MELTRLIPSCYIRDELRKNGSQLSDAEKQLFSGTLRFHIQKSWRSYKS